METEKHFLSCHSLVHRITTIIKRSDKITLNIFLGRLVLLFILTYFANLTYLYLSTNQVVVVDALNRTGAFVRNGFFTSLRKTHSPLILYHCHKRTTKPYNMKNWFILWKHYFHKLSMQQSLRKKPLLQLNIISLFVCTYIISAAI